MARSYPEQPLVSCHGLAIRDNAVLLVRRARPPHVGSWSVPGGGVELGETVAEAVVRETKEETGLDVSVSRMLGYHDAIDYDSDGRILYHYVIFYFLVGVTGGELLPGDDAAAVQWLPQDEIRSQPVTDSVLRCLKWLQQS